MASTGRHAVWLLGGRVSWLVKLRSAPLPSGSCEVAQHTQSSSSSSSSKLVSRSYQLFISMTYDQA
jgi:hypothetical protein